MAGARPPLRIGIIGAGVAGSVIANGLARLPGVEARCFERVARSDHQQAGTGLNVGPNALKCLRAFLPDLWSEVTTASLPWDRWTVGLTDGTRLMDLALADVADNPGIRIRWSELYRVLRRPIADTIVFDAPVEAATVREDAVQLTWRALDGTAHQEAFDLVIVGDGRYSAIRDTHFGTVQPAQLGIALFRTLFEQPDRGPIGDYGQWFCGANRLLAFETPGGAVYCAGSFPIPIDRPIPEAMKTPQALGGHYGDRHHQSAECRFLVDQVVRCAQHGDIHWARIQFGGVRYAHPSGRMVLVGDAAHPIVPTLGQGATQAIEDACVILDLMRHIVDGGAAVTTVPARVEALRAHRVRFVADLSRRATDTMLPGTDPVQGTQWKTEPAFLTDLATLYRHPPMPGDAAASAV